MADREHVVQSIAHAGGELQVRRVARGTDAPVTELGLWSLDNETGELSLHGSVSVRDSELEQLIGALVRIHRHVKKPVPKPPREKRTRHRKRAPDGPTGATTAGLTDAELREREEAF